MPGRVLRCRKRQVARAYDFTQNGDSLFCRYGNLTGIDNGRFITMIDTRFIVTGTKRKKITRLEFSSGHNHPNVNDKIDLRNALN
jgi:hypothetical protein